jgi:hypothetical protein
LSSDLFKESLKERIQHKRPSRMGSQPSVVISAASV